MKRYQTKTIGRVFSLYVVFLLVFGSSVYASAQFTNAQTLVFNGDQVSPGSLYQDGTTANVDVGLRLCDQGQRFIGAFYYINVNGDQRYRLISYSSTTNALSFTSTNDGGGCYSMPGGFMTISPSALTSTNPHVFQAAFPGRLWIGRAASANPGTIDNFVFAGTGAVLAGSYSAPRSFDQVTRQVTVQSPTITFQRSAGTFTKSASDPVFGIGTTRPMALGICNEPTGADCSGGDIYTAPVFPLSLDSGLSAAQVNDQQTHIRYVVANGLGDNFCIGADLRGQITNINPNPVFYSQDLTINLRIFNPTDGAFQKNGGNVAVTSPFNIRVTIGNATTTIFEQVLPITEGVPVNGEVFRQIVWPAFARSGFYTVTLQVDSTNQIAECNENNNQATATFELKPITLPEVFIDGIETREFDQPNIPYRLGVFLKNSDNLTLRNASFILVEENALNLFAPTQIFNRTIGINETIKDAPVVKNRVEMFSNFDGFINLTIIPSFNTLLTDAYNYTDLQSYVSAYSLYFKGVQEDGEPFIFVEDGELTSQFNFTMLSFETEGPFPDKEIYSETLVTQVMEFIYGVFTNFIDVVLR